MANTLMVSQAKQEDLNTLNGKITSRKLDASEFTVTPTTGVTVNGKAVFKIIEGVYYFYVSLSVESIPANTESYMGDISITGFTRTMSCVGSAEAKVSNGEFSSSARVTTGGNIYASNNTGSAKNSIDIRISGILC